MSPRPHVPNDDTAWLDPHPRYWRTRNPKEPLLCPADGIPMDENQFYELYTCPRCHRRWAREHLEPLLRGEEPTRPVSTVRTPQTP